MWQHQHVFNVEKKTVEKQTLIVVIITLITMIAEIFFGWLTNSMALFADGWHMGTHAFALGLSLLAYVLARKYAQDDRFTFGAWKIEILGAYTSSILLGIVGLFMIYTSIERIINPLEIQYNQALLVAIIGLAVNIVCAVILNAEGHSHDHHQDEHKHSKHHHDHKDLNRQSAYLHILADALTSVLAIVALFGAKYFQLNWLDPFMGIVGAGLILRWTALLLKDSAKILLEREMDSPIKNEIIEEIESDGDTKISDLHIWQVAQNKYACIISLVMGRTYTIDDYKMRLKNIHEIAHVTIEIHQCRGHII
ncbi:MAG TPA: CDF family Co(II)/Ni(II) efflux transporter DmeF [Syntrophales bacterium]|nr:CDF family Co(II)/Ni(II) efflux transporter DmeF [Syntrophales bacterium]